MICPYIETADYYFIWKPHHIPSSFGKEKSFIDYLLQPQIQNPEINIPKDLATFVLKQFSIKGHKAADINQIIKVLKSEFSSTQEYGLLNRLDNETAGYLYFAKNRQIYDKYKSLQKQGRLKKVYLAQVYGNPFFKGQSNSMIIDYPIAHHKSDDKKMLAIKTEDDKQKSRGQIKHPQTNVELISYDSKTNISSLAVSISKGVRHQIRLHLSSIGCAIIGDSIYGKKGIGILHLWSLGFQIKYALTNSMK